MSIIKIGKVMGDVLEAGAVKNVTNNYYGEKTEKEKEKDLVVAVEQTDENAPQPPSFENTIPEYLRIGNAFQPWARLKEKKLLIEDFRLAKGVPKAAAKFMAEQFCRGREQVEWRHFEEFWGIKNLRNQSNTFAENTKNTILCCFND